MEKYLNRLDREKEAELKKLEKTDETAVDNSNKDAKMQ